MEGELAHEDSDVEERADTAQIPETPPVRHAAQPLDVGLEVKRRAVHVPDADGIGSDPEGVDHPRRHRGGFAAVSVDHSPPIKTSSEPSSTSYSSVRRGWRWG